ncbi:hypothetical protein EZJ19_06995 [Parasulfuritortus cantonensis]|uniref:Uncharacterized protein n=1 Tax=Parasulfuritortus cantonensis TaxID=2528202 RepID=A0A4R1BDZ4_9PROT|nr:hypothetical protein [Parasulfuritortus cantonensis]TCJ15356.1 hypothetical protein EZJ19_06995 [Parasulfuritortus cantonensis]
MASIEYTEKSLAWLEDHHLPAILISNRRVQSDDEARLMAERHGAVYYGSLFRAVPKDADHVQMGEWQMKKGGQTDNHMTAKGYGVLAKLMRKSVKTVIEANHLD